MTGIAIVLYLNQTPSQPRERDYAYAGSFYAFAIWIGMGVAGLVRLLQDYAKMKELPAAAIVSPQSQQFLNFGYVQLKKQYTEKGRFVTFLLVKMAANNSG